MTRSRETLLTGNTIIRAWCYSACWRLNLHSHGVRRGTHRPFTTAVPWRLKSGETGTEVWGHGMESHEQTTFWRCAEREDGAKHNSPKGHAFPVYFAGWHLTDATKPHQQSTSEIWEQGDIVVYIDSTIEHTKMFCSCLVLLRPIQVFLSFSKRVHVYFCFNASSCFENNAIKMLVIFCANSMLVHALYGDVK